MARRPRPLPLPLVRRALHGLLLLGTGATAGAHVSDPNLSMRAEVVAEVSIGSTGIRVELEAPPGAAPSLAGLAPVITINRSTPLVPQPLEAGRRARVQRDLVTGRPVAGEGAEAAVGTFRYPLPTKPELLAIAPPEGAPGDYGFAVYHDGIPVGRFNYLRREELLTLDWGDPFYTRFRNPRLRRAFGAPLELFLTDDGGGLRLDVLARPRDVLPTLGVDALPATIADRDAVLEAMEDWAGSAFTLRPGGAPISGEPEVNSRFISRSLKGTAEVPATREVRMADALAAISITWNTGGGDLDFGWNWFTPRIQRVPLVFSHGAETVRSALAPDRGDFSWRAPVASPSPRAAVPSAPTVPRWRIPHPGLLAASLLFSLIALRSRRIRLPARLAIAAAIPAAAWFALAATGTETAVRDPFAKGEPIARERADSLCHHVLSHALGAASSPPPAPAADGDPRLSALVRPLRPDLQRVDEFGEPRKLRRLTLLQIEYAGTPSSFGFTATCAAELYLGSAHWGHVHNERLRRGYTFTVEPVAGRWEVTDIRWASGGRDELDEVEPPRR